MAASPLPETLEEILTPLAPDTPPAQRLEIERAYAFASRIHGDVVCSDGQTCLRRALGTAQIIAGLGMDGYCVAAALLHDALQPHTEQTLAGISTAVSERTAEMVRGIDEIVTYTSNNANQVHGASDTALENIRRALLILVRKDVHVILIHMAHYVIRMRQAAQLPEAERQSLAAETMNVYAPLANRLGVWQLKWELEDLAFRYLEPEQYHDLAQRLNSRRAERDQVVGRAIQRLEEELAQAGIKAQVTGRSKHIYSIYRKMERKQLGFEDIYDKHAIRVIVFTGHDGQRAIVKTQRQKSIQEARALCYQVLGIVHGAWQFIPQEFDDYIANPKPNGYQSLHTAVIDESGHVLEVQIRTDVMHTEAERGVAAHWAYKEDNRPSQAVTRYIQSLRQTIARGGLNQEPNDDDLYDGEIVQSDLLDERIFVYTPRGDMVDLPVDTTPVDFAYAIHSEVGHRCRGAKVNGKMVSLDHRLKSGDRVEIITTKRPGPSRDWMNPNLGYTGSPRTRSKVRRWFRQQEKEQNTLQGRDIVTRELRRLGLLDNLSVDDIALALNFDDLDEFLAAVGFGDIQTVQIGGAIAKLRQKLKPDDELLNLLNDKPDRARTSKGLTVRGLSGLHTRMAGCCNPIPPEPIVGYITRGSGVTIHSADCKTLLSIGEKERFIEVEWGQEQETYPIPIVVDSFRRNQLAEEISKILHGRNVGVTRTKSITQNNQTTVYLVVEVATLDQLDWTLRKLESLPTVIEVRRQRWTG